MTAGCRLAAAVPEVQVTATGRPVALAIPSAKKPAQRSSSTETTSISGRAASVSASGALREPGQVTA
jgi:antitoxin (DNA-binding transcriptional repressor) of toxin-antitoxin stability system